MDQIAARAIAGSAAPAVVTPSNDPVPNVAPDEGWVVLVTSGPNKGAAVPLGHGTFRLGAGLSNDIVLADPAMADEQVLLSFDASGAHVTALAPGLSIDAKSMQPGRSVTVKDGASIHAGDTALQLRGPPRPRRRTGWLLVTVPLLLLLGVGGTALVGVASPSRGDAAPPRSAPAITTTAYPATEAADALRERLQQAGLAEQINLTASSGAVVAEGSLPGPGLARWAEQQLWFDGRYKGALSLISRVREASSAERPNLQLRAVSTGRVPYLIVANGDRYVEGAVVDGWTIDQISAEKIVLSRNGRRVELAL